MKMKTGLIWLVMAVPSFILMVMNIFVHKYKISVKAEKYRLNSEAMYSVICSLLFFFLKNFSVSEIMHVWCLPREEDNSERSSWRYWSQIVWRKLQKPQWGFNILWSKSEPVTSSCKSCYKARNQVLINSTHYFFSPACSLPYVGLVLRVNYEYFYIHPCYFLRGETGVRKSTPIPVILT
jgi:hypothetical protein